MKRALVAPALCIAVLAALPTAGLAKPRPCLGASARLIEATANVIVYRSRRPGYDVWGACWRPTGRRTRIAPPRDFVIGGHLLAYVTITCIRGDETCSNTIYRIDLTGRQTFAPVGGDAVGRLVLTPSGAVGYVKFAYTGSNSGVVTTTKEIRKVDSTGESVLDQGEGIDPESLALGGSTLYWTDAGQARSEVLR